MNRFVIDTSMRKALSTRYCGGKGANLARLIRYGFNVPPAVIISTTFYQQLIKKHLRYLKKQTTDGKNDFKMDGFSRISETEMAERLKEMLEPFLFHPEFPLAVRSSAVCEDGSEFSFAGQLETFLNINTSGELWDAIHRCYAALLNARVQSYMTHVTEKGGKKRVSEISMAVILQRMVNSTASGVAFSANPITGQICILIEAVRGLGDKLVAGTANPDRYMVHSSLKEYESHPANLKKPVLTSEQVLSLASLVTEISRKFNRPQDIEWAWDGTEFFVLQSRPVTALGAKPVYSSRLVSDMTPGLIKPLVWSTNLMDMCSNVFGRIFSQIYGPNQINFHQLIRRIHSRVYINITFLADVFEKIGLPANFFDFIIKDEKPVLTQWKFSRRSLMTVLRLGQFIGRQSCIRRKLGRFIEKYDIQMEKFRQTDWRDQDIPGLISGIRRLRRMHRETQWYMWTGAMNMTVRNKILKKMVIRHAPGVNPSDLIRGLIGLKSLEPNHEMQKMAASWKKLPDDVQQKIFDFTPLKAKIPESFPAEALEFHRQYQSFLQKYGYLSMNGTDFSITPWIENSGIISHAIQRFSTNTPTSDPEIIRRQRKSAQKQIEMSLHGMAKLFFPLLLKSTKRYIALREKLSLFISEDAYQMRRIYLRMGEYLVTTDKLNAKNDVFYLYYPELLEILQDKTESTVLRKKISLRKKNLAEDSQIKPEDLICHTSMPGREVAELSYLEGIAGSSGSRKGIARIVRNPADIGKNLTKEDILIVPFIDVGWTPLFPGIGGLVTEVGGQLSHSAIIAREYGLPALLSVKNATHLIREGQTVFLDADNGRVYLHVN